MELLFFIIVIITTPCSVPSVIHNIILNSHAVFQVNLQFNILGENQIIYIVITHTYFTWMLV
jgi:hypothetical protein